MSISVSPVTNSQSFGVWLSRSNQVYKIISNNAVTCDTTADGSLTTGNAYVNGVFSAVTLTANNGLRGGDVNTVNTLFISSNTVYTPNGSSQPNTLYITANSTVSQTQVTSVVTNITSTNTSISGTNLAISSTNTNITSSGLGVTSISTFSGNTSFKYSTDTVLSISSNSSLYQLTANVGNLHITGTTSNLVATYVGINSQRAVISGNTEVSALKVDAISYTDTTTYTTSGTSAETVDSFALATFRSAEYTVSITSGSSYQSSKLLVLHDGTTASVTEFGTLRTGSNLITFDADISGSNVRLRGTSTSSGTVINIHRVAMYV